MSIKTQKRQPHPIGAFSRARPLASESSICGFSYTKWFITPAFYKYYVPKTLMLWQASHREKNAACFLLLGLCCDSKTKTKKLPETGFFHLTNRVKGRKTGKQELLSCYFSITDLSLCWVSSPVTPDALSTLPHSLLCTKKLTYMGYIRGSLALWPSAGLGPWEMGTRQRVKVKYLFLPLLAGDPGLAAFLY